MAQAELTYDNLGGAGYGGGTHMAIDCREIGSRIKYYRLKSQLSQERLAEMTGLSHVYISYLERGERMPRLDAIINIANALSVSADDLLSGSLLVSGFRNETKEIEMLYDCTSEELSIILKCMAFLKELLKGYKITK